MVERIPNYLDGKTFSNLMNIILASSKIQTLQLPHKTERPQFHVILKGYSGSGKSTILYEVCDRVKQIPVMNLTKASFLGAVDKNTGMFIPPITWSCRNSILPIDEYSFNHKNPADKDLLSTLLQVMEKPLYSKPLGYRCNDVKMKKKDLYCIVKENVIKVKTRFTLFMTTMFNIKKSQSILMEALVNRCLVIPFYPSLEDLKQKVRGKTYYKFHSIPVSENVSISKKNYNKILRFVDKNVYDEKAYMRTVGDLCRIFSVLGKHNLGVYRLVIALRGRI